MDETTKVEPTRVVVEELDEQGYEDNPYMKVAMELRWGDDDSPYVAVAKKMGWLGLKE
jgi:hypothetical protein